MKDEKPAVEVGGRAALYSGVGGGQGRLSTDLAVGEGRST